MMSDKHGRLRENGNMKWNRTGRRTLCWGLKKYKNHSANVNGRSFCLTLWDRDVNAALNIRQGFLYRNDHNESP
jgi:transposase